MNNKKCGVRLLIKKYLECCHHLLYKKCVRLMQITQNHIKLLCRRVMELTMDFHLEQIICLLVERTVLHKLINIYYLLVTPSQNKLFKGNQVILKNKNNQIWDNKINDKNYSLYIYIYYKLIINYFIKIIINLTHNKIYITLFY